MTWLQKETAVLPQGIIAVTLSGGGHGLHSVWLSDASDALSKSSTTVICSASPKKKTKKENKCQQAKVDKQMSLVNQVNNRVMARRRGNTRHWASLSLTPRHSFSWSSWSSWAVSMCWSWDQTSLLSPGWRTHHPHPPRTGSHPSPPHLTKVHKQLWYKLHFCLLLTHLTKVH